jgi:hypothetical protein
MKSMMSSVRRAARLDDAPRTATVPGTLLEQAASGRVFIETWTPNGGCFRVTFGEMADCMLAAASVLSALDVKKADYVALVRQFIQAPTLPCVACSVGRALRWRPRFLAVGAKLFDQLLRPLCHGRALSIAERLLHGARPMRVRHIARA